MEGIKVGRNERNKKLEEMEGRFKKRNMVV